MKKYLLILILLLSLFAQALSNSISSINLEKINSIAVDIRGVRRGGMGDVLAGYLFALDAFQTHGFRGKITLIVDSKSRSILKKVWNPQSEFSRHVKVHSAHSIAHLTFNRVDLFIDLARVTGGSIGSTIARAPLLKGLIGDKTVVVQQSVLGNTENRSWSRPFGTIHYMGESHFISHAGAGAEHMGVYSDSVAGQLKGMSVPEIDQFLLHEFESYPEQFKLLRSLILGEVLAESKMGLVYGISRDKVHGQFENYLQGIKDHIKQKDIATIITPSSFHLEQVQDLKLRDRIIVVRSEKELKMQGTPPKGSIVIIVTPTLPHAIFTGLMARSAWVPIVSGDNALSAAIGLGKPFVMTSVGWNSDNVRAISERLQKNAKDSKLSSLVWSVFSGIGDGLRYAQNLNTEAGKSLFEQIGKQIPSVFEHIHRLVHHLKEGALPVTSADHIRDPVYRFDSLWQQFLAGKSSSRQQLLHHLEKYPILSFQVLSARSRPHQVMKSLFQEPFFQTAFFQVLRESGFRGSGPFMHNLVHRSHPLPLSFYKTALSLLINSDTQMVNSGVERFLEKIEPSAMGEKNRSFLISELNQLMENSRSSEMNRNAFNNVINALQNPKRVNPGCYTLLRNRFSFLP